MPLFKNIFSLICLSLLHSHSTQKRQKFQNFRFPKPSLMKLFNFVCIDIKNRCVSIGVMHFCFHECAAVSSIASNHFYRLWSIKSVKHRMTGRFHRWNCTFIALSGTILKMIGNIFFTGNCCDSNCEHNHFTAEFIHRGSSFTFGIQFEPNFFLLPHSPMTKHRTVSLTFLYHFL